MTASANALGMLKAAPVTLVRASVVCAGRFLILVGGDREAVDASVQAARATEARLAGSYVVSNVSSQVLNVLRRMNGTAIREKINALGIIETYTAASCVLAADAAAKAGDVHLVELRLSAGLGGKAFVLMP